MGAVGRRRSVVRAAGPIQIVTVVSATGRRGRQLDLAIGPWSGHVEDVRAVLERSLQTLRLVAGRSEGRCIAVAIPFASAPSTTKSAEAGPVAVSSAAVAPGRRGSHFGRVSQMIPQSVCVVLADGLGPAIDGRTEGAAVGRALAVAVRLDSTVPQAARVPATSSASAIGPEWRPRSCGHRSRAGMKGPRRPQATGSSGRDELLTSSSGRSAARPSQSSAADRPEPPGAETSCGSAYWLAAWTARTAGRMPRIRSIASATMAPIRTDGEGDLAHRCVHVRETPMCASLFHRFGSFGWESCPGC